MSVTIKKMHQKDVDSVAKLEEQIFSDPWSRESLSKSLENSIYSFLVAKEAGILVGYIGIYTVEGEANIVNAAVSSAFRRQGIGKALLEAMIFLCRENQIKAITLEVRVSNYKAIQLYEKYGFESVGIRTNFYANPREDAMIMWKRDLITKE